MTREMAEYYDFLDDNSPDAEHALHCQFIFGDAEQSPILIFRIKDVRM